MLYSELPFMQQVHEGAYDFTRYTLSGHRRLFNGFLELEAGMVAGPGTALAWAIESLALAIVARRLRAAAKASVRFAFFWLKYIDILIARRPAEIDGASCTYFFGTRQEGLVSDLQIIRNYKGAGRIEHIIPQAKSQE